MVSGKMSVRSAFTLVEMAVVLVLFGILVMFAAGMLAPLLRSEISATQERDIDKAMNRLIQRVRLSFNDVPLFANLNWNQATDENDNSTFRAIQKAPYDFATGSTALFYANDFFVFDSNGRKFNLYSGIPIKRGYFTSKANSLASTADWFEYSRKVCEHTDATITVVECLNEGCAYEDNISSDNATVTTDVAYLITTANMSPVVTSKNAFNSANCRSRTGNINAAAPLALDDCPGSVNNPRTIRIPYAERYDGRFKLVTLGRLRDEVGCSTGFIIPRNYSPPTVHQSSYADYVPEGYVGRIALTFTVSNGWPMYWCIEWEHERSRIFTNSGGKPQAAPTRVAESWLGKAIVTNDDVGAGNVRSYCLRNSDGNDLTSVDPKYISFGDSQLIHVLAAPIGNESTAFTSDHGEFASSEDRVRLRNRGVYHLNLYISDRPDMSKIIDHVTLNFVQ
ncbi:MAG: prepilin-type N-terminal cleavage/methylation domain-containing protein [Deferribacteraceae bacterium]|jgi:prepilin-type N-terminal cleavage/methylation domain-containing protein|nr:prepilin-type N-terminal cleavage/methylation domain-containing protein [Deferribacteraceae bacterium]